MGGRGSSSRISTPVTRLSSGAAQQQQAAPAPISQQPPTDANTPVQPGALTALSQMTDDQLAALAQKAKGIDMPNMLADVHNDTQEFVFAAGLNEKPTVLDDTAFAQFLQDNHIPQSQLLARSVDPQTYHNKDGTRVTLTANDIIDMMKYSRLNYIGGKYGGRAYGSGTYFDQNGGHATGYGGSNSKTAVAALNPKTAKVISWHSLHTQAAAFAKSHPKFARVVGAPQYNPSIYALVMGYNVIDAGNGYHNVIDRSALVYRESNS